MNGGRGAKGSINDRLISMMYRNRYKRLQLQKESFRTYNKIRQKEFLNTIKHFDITDIDRTYSKLESQDKTVLEEALKTIAVDEEITMSITNSRTLSGIQNVEVSQNQDNTTKLHEASENLIDLENHDYYEITNKYSGAFETYQDQISPEKELKKIDNELIIVEELNTFIDESKEIIEVIKNELNDIQLKTNEAHTEEQMQKLEEQFINIQKKINELKTKYQIVSEKYDFEDFQILASIAMMSAITDYKNETSLAEIETLVNFCKDEIEAIDSIIIEEKRSIGIAHQIEEKDIENKEREEKFEQNKKGIHSLNEIEKQIAYEANIQKEIIEELELKLRKVETSISTVKDTVFATEKLFGSFLRIAAGILTLPFSGSKVFGTVLGLQLIDRGVKNLNESLTPTYITRQQITHRYTDIEREIIDSQDQVNSANKLVDGSIDQIVKFEREFYDRFSKYSELIPEYGQLEKTIATLKTKLNQKKVAINIMEKDLARQYTANKVKVKKYVKE